MSEIEEGVAYDGAERRNSSALEGMIDRRQHRRYAVNAWAEVMLKDATILFRGRVLDISVAGCFVATEARLKLAPGTSVEILIQLGNRMLRCDATSRMMRVNGAGFLFERIDAKTRMMLEALVAELEAAGA